MISMLIGFVLGTIFALILTRWVRSLGKYKEYDYCYGCNAGLCLEDPKSEKCERWKNETRLDAGGLQGVSKTEGEGMSAEAEEDS